MPSPRHRRTRSHVVVAAVLLALTLAACDREQPTTVEPPVSTTLEPVAATADVDALRARVELADEHLEAALAAWTDGEADPEVDVEDEVLAARLILAEVLEGLVPTATPAPAAPLDPPASP
jgi:hypothetical protein